MISARLRLVLIGLLGSALLITIRLFYWQVLAADDLVELAQSQHLSQIQIPAVRGKIITSDNFDLVGNQPAFLSFAYLPDLETDSQTIAQKLAPIVTPDPEASATAKAIKKQLKDTQATLSARLTNPDIVWTPLARKISLEQKKQIEAFEFKGIGFEPEQIRFYPEASMSAHLLGFVASNSQGNPQGYFGLEGFYDLELKGRPGIIRQEKDAAGRPILVGSFGGFQSKNGRNLKLYLDRSIQNIVETQLEWGIKQYGAVSGEVIIMDPATGGIISMASLPKYDPQNLSKYDSSIYKNPVIANSYEPGSTFKVLVMAAALDADAVKPDTKCDICDGPTKIGKYTIRTWNQEYRADITMTEVIQHSDNVGMVFAGFELGKDKLYDYLDKFGIGRATGIDLQEESTPQMRPKRKWGDIDLATTSFGQGIAVTGMQMVKAVSAIANKGVIMKPQMVKQIIGDKIIDIKPQSQGRVISAESAQKITDIMVTAVNSGEAQWTKMKGYNIAGKTGTAQIPVQGHYDEEKTIASFIGFAPADNPKFVMLVKLREPSSSPWAAETAAPLWMRIARQLFLYYGVAPGQ